MPTLTRLIPPLLPEPPLAIRTALAVMEKNVLTTLTVSSIVQLVEVIIMTVSQLLFEWQFVTICLAFLLFLMYVYSLNFPACQGSYPHHAFQLLHGPALTLLLSVIWLLFIHASKPCSSLLDASFDPITVRGPEELGMFSSSMSRWNKTQFI